MSITICLKPKVTSSNGLFCLTKQSLNPNDIITQNKEKQHALPFEKLESVNVWHSCLKNYLNLIDCENSCQFISVNQLIIQLQS